jgi:nucleotide-binding universal stress UspA family protein
VGRASPGSVSDSPHKERSREIANEVVEHQAEVARKLGAEVDSLVLDGQSPESAIIDLVARNQYDLIVMGTSIRTIRRRAFFGHRAEALLKTAPCSVAVVSTH